ncbi:MAG TPA: valine--tRNA ligase [Acholeplasmataceae bacterium]|nr:valine--tRNA ligase [Acholeplasmataceae bacterium]
MKLKDLSTKYDFKEVEANKYQDWVDKGLFTAGDISKKPYAVVIPPPNITGKLHLGHVWDNTLQDIIVRRKRMMGYDVLYLPGMDHASIATQAKVEEKLRKQNISRYDLGREKFLEEAWKWKDEYAETIRKQWAIIGLSLDYTRERFTLDEGLNYAVNYVFTKMYEDGLIYRGEKIINWDVQSQTALSNIEVEYKDIEGAFYHFIYPFVDGEGGLEIATTRPETMFGDTALMVHPDDSRYQKYIGREVYIPGTQMKIPVIADDYVDKDFGTGVVKVTPAHDPNDFEVGLRHNLPRPLCMTEDGKMNHLAGKYEGLDRFECRKKVVEDLQKIGLCPKVEKIIHSVGHSERTGVIVEPRLSKQWFVKMDKLASDVIEMQKTKDRVNFVPRRFEKTFLNWLDNIQDWCISRQLWWGHQIPAWYRGDEIYVGVTPPKGEGWKRDEDALDTWFSSALWPFSTLGWPENTFDFQRYFPTDTLVTGYDIIFFWVARMVFQSKYLIGKRPFKDVLLHGLIRDEQGRKISKSLGNGVDMIDAVDQFGIDSLRYFLATTTSPGQDIRYSETKIEAAWNYINKIWNISRYIGINFDDTNYQNEEINVKLLNSVDKWILQKTNDLITNTNYNYEKYEFGEVAKAIYKFVWDDFASWYLEMTKVIFNGDNQELKINTCAVLRYVLTVILKLLHPFMPFVTEHIYQKFNEGYLCVSDWPKRKRQYTFKDAFDIEIIYDIITFVRNTRAVKRVANSQKIDLLLQVKNEEVKKIINNNIHYLQRFVNYQNLTVTTEELDTKQSVVEVLNDVIAIIPLKTLVDLEEEKQKLEDDRKKMLQEIKRCQGMLNNPNFVSKAPKEKVELEKRKLEEYLSRLDEIEKLLQDF